MSLVRNFRNHLSGTPYRVAALGAALVALLFVRFTPPPFSEMPSAQATVVCHSAHDPRPCFDPDDQGWSVPAASIAIAPPEVSHHSPSVTELILPFQTKGSHYNRPPPLS
jgi:hypothetical protein